MKLWVDADACPRPAKELVFRTGTRLGLPVVLVANSGQALPRSQGVTFVQVGREIDAADRHILAHAEAGDLVVTADIPLAAAAVDAGIAVINPNGSVYSPENVKEALASRDLAHSLREEGVMTGGAAPYGPRERERFANALDRELTRLRRTAPSARP
jgi:uncharacterized protein